MKRKTLAFLCVLAMAFGMLMGCSSAAAPAKAGPAAASSGAADDGKTYTLRFGHPMTEQDPFHKAYLKWAEAVKEKTNGKVVIEVYPNSELGVEEDVLEQIKQGTNVGWQTDAARLGNYVNDFSVLLAPYFLDNIDEAKSLLKSPTVQKWEKQLEEEDNMKVLSFAYIQGFRNVFSNKKATNPTEFRSLQIRTANAPVWVASVKSLGCSPVSLAYGDLYNGIQTKIVDGCELPYIAAQNLRVNEVAKYILETQHIFQTNFQVCSATWFNSLPKEYQDIVTEECDKAGLDASDQMATDTEASKQALIKGGMTYVPFSEMDIAAFKKAGQAAYDSLKLNDARKAVYADIGKTLSN